MKNLFNSSRAKVFEMFKEFLYYQQISIKEEFDIESEKPHLERYDKTKSRKCILCRQVFIIKKNFKNNDKDCNQYFKITNRTDADHLMKKEENLEKFGNIDVNKYVESLNSFFLEMQTPKLTFHFFGKSKTALKLHCICIT